MPNQSLVATLAVLAVAAHSTEAFAPPVSGIVGAKSSMPGFSPLYAEESSEETAVFVPPPEPVEEKKEGEVDLSTVEMLGRGAAKAKRGKRKGGPVAKKSWKRQILCYSSS